MRNIEEEKFITAYNNTYGKGINPEGVEKMKKALYEAITRLKLYEEDGDNAEIVELGFKALTAAKL